MILHFFRRIKVIFKKKSVNNIIAALSQVIENDNIMFVFPYF